MSFINLIKGEDEYGEVTPKSLLIQFIIRLSFIIVAILACYCFGNKEIVQYFHNYNSRDIGSIILLVGIIMGVACFFDITQGFFSVKPFNIACSATMIIFGISLNLWGLSSAIFATGGLACILAYFLHPLLPKISGVLLVSGIVIIIISYIPIFSDTPTAIPRQKDRPVDIASAEWQIILGNQNGNEMELPIDKCATIKYELKTLKHPVADYYNYTHGTEASVIKNTQDLLAKFISSNPKSNLWYIKIKCKNMPDYYEQKYGLPDVYFYYKYIHSDGRITLANN